MTKGYSKYNLKHQTLILIKFCIAFPKPPANQCIRLSIEAKTFRYQIKMVLAIHLLENQPQKTTLIAMDLQCNKTDMSRSNRLSIKNTIMS